MMFIVGMIVGGCLGVLVACVAVANAKTEAYLQGFDEGLKVGEGYGKKQQTDKSV